MQIEDESNLNAHLARKYPGLEAEKRKNGAFIISGVANIEQTWNRLKLYLPHYPELRDFQLHVQHQLEYKSFNSGNLQIQPDWRFDDLLSHLPHLLPALPAVDSFLAPHDVHCNIYAEILALHKPISYRIQVDESCKRIRFSRFAEHEQHYLQLELPTMRLLEHSLPDCVPWSELFAKGACTLSDMLALFLKFLEELRPFYECFQDIDELCHVLQPSPITTKDNTRVFPLSERVYLKVSIANPFASGSSMTQIIGPTEEVARLRHVLSDGLSSWDTELDMHKNLLRIFDLCYFPMPPVEMSCDQSQDKEEEQHQLCNICYVYRLDCGEVPLVSCDNARCVLKCHASCLREWFNTLSDGKTFLEVSFGLCPFCKAKLSTSFAALLAE